MSSQIDQAHRNAFTVDFLERLDELREPDGAHEADAAGPWAIRPVSYRGGVGFALLREWESVEAGDVPYAVFRRRETALLAAAVLPGTGREPLFHLGTESDAFGFPVLATSATGAVADPDHPGSPSSSAADGASGANTTHAANFASPVFDLPAADPVGHLRDFDEALVSAMHLASALVRSPMSLARLLEAAGHAALEQAGRILGRHVQ